MVYFWLILTGKALHLDWEDLFLKVGSEFYFVFPEGAKELGDSR